MFEEECHTRIIAKHLKQDYPLLILLSIATAGLFHNLSVGSLPPFDDTTYALVSKTILKTGDWLTMRWLDIPYFVFGKPPLNFWITALFYKMLGISEFSSRISAAIHGLMGVALVYFVGRKFYSRKVGIAAGAFLLSFPDYFRLSQSAMLDVPVTFYMVFSLLAYLLACRSGMSIWYVVSGISIGLGIMTKNVVGLVPLVAIALLHLIERKPSNLVTSQFCSLLAALLLTAVPWHLWEYASYGISFLEKYLLGTITYNALEVLNQAQRSSPFFYVRTLYANDPVHWIAFLVSLPGLAILAIRKHRESLLILVYTALVLLLFTASKTRMPWYIAPAFPTMAISAAVGISKIQEVRRLRPAITVLLIGFFIYSMAALYRTDHWYLRGDADLKQIILEFKSKTSVSDVLFCYGFGEPVNTGAFYGDRKVVVLTNSNDELRIQTQISDYLKAGLVQFVNSEDAMVHRVCSSRNHDIIFRRQAFHVLETKLEAQAVTTFAENASYVIVHLPCVEPRELTRQGASAN